MASPADLSACEAIERVRSGDLQAEQFIAVLLERQRRLASLNTLTWIDEQRALQDAREIDRKRSRNETLGALAGLPLLIKDNIAVAGAPNAAGTLTLRDYVPSKNAPVVQRLLDEEAIVFARANMHELAGGGTSSNPSFGVVANPYDPKRVPGGSSGGTAAALAARLAPAGLGSDTAGSVRIPSALSGTVGLRPTISPEKLYPDEGIVPLAVALDTVGPMARSVADVVLLHKVISGAPVPVMPDAKSLRIGIPSKPYWEDVEEQVGVVTQHALERLREAGVTFVDVNVGGYYSLAHEIYMTLVTQGIKEDLQWYLSASGCGVSAREVIEHIASRDTRTLFEDCATSQISPATFAKARGILRDKIQVAYRQIFSTYDVAAILFPTSPIVAPLINPHGDRRDAEIELNGRRVNLGQTLFRNTRVTGALGAPGLSLPAGLTREGLPVGLELDGLNGADAELLSVGLRVEQILGPLPPPL